MTAVKPSHFASSDLLHRLNHRSEHPVSITSAPLSQDEDYERRRRRYAIMMATRAACVLAAVFVSGVSLLLSMVFVVGGAVLPWCAVLIANDRLPIDHRRVPAPMPNRPKALPATPDGRVIDL